MIDRKRKKILGYRQSILGRMPPVSSSKSFKETKGRAKNRRIRKKDAESIQSNFIKINKLIYIR